MQTFKAAVVSIGALLASAGLAMAGTYEEGMVAKNRGDYAAALRLLEPLARQGDSNSQFQLSLLYSNGQGVPANMKESLKWLRLAARKGNASAQSNLGAAYSRGLVVPQDDIRAVAWLSIAAASGSKEAATNRQVAQRRMTPQQISQANAMANACLQSNLQACD